MSNSVPPKVIPLSEATVIPAHEAVTKVRIARIVSRISAGSSLLQGVAWMDPGEQTNTWSSRSECDVSDGDHWYGDVDETYFIISGRLRLTWDEGYFDLGPNDSVYLAPGWRYHLENIGEEQAFFVYSMTPTPE